MMERKNPHVHTADWRQGNTLTSTLLVMERGTPIRVISFSGREEDKETVIAVRKLLELVSSFPDHFDETTMFNGGQHAKVRYLFS